MYACACRLSKKKVNEANEFREMKMVKYCAGERIYNYLTEREKKTVTFLVDKYAFFSFLAALETAKTKSTYFIVLHSFLWSNR